jgi:hypothetical protein
MPQPNNALSQEHEGRLQLALQAYQSKQFRSYQAAAAAFNVHHHTLTRRANGVLFRLETPANSHKLTATEEQPIF